MSELYFEDSEPKRTGSPRFSRSFFLRTLGIIFVVALFFGAVFFLYAKNRKRGSESVQERKLVAVKDVEEEKEDNFYFKDSDGDGVFDWKERALGLDPHNPDSDGDGVDDGTYVRHLEQEELKKVPPSEVVSPTERLGRALYLLLYSMDKNGVPLTEEKKEELAEQVGEYMRELDLGGRLYTRKDITIVEDTPENSFAYEEEVKKLFETYPVKTSEFDLIFRALENPEDMKSRVERTIAKYDSYLQELEKVSVPGIVVKRHLQLMNSLSRLQTTLRIMVNRDEVEDEILIFSALLQIEKLVDDTIESIVKIQDYFQIIHDPYAFS